MLYREMYPVQFMKYMAALKGLGGGDTAGRIDELIEFVGLENDKKKKIGQFSGGMKQRIGIAQALPGNPALIILDEPTAGLDPRERVRFKNIISALAKDHIVLLVTHILSDIENMSGNIIFLSRGRVIESGPITEILAAAEGVQSLEEYYMLRSGGEADGKI